MSNSSTSDAMEPIAVVGLGCRFPGNATSPVALWDMLREGQSAWSEIPQERMNVASYFHPSGNRQGTVPFMSAHFIDEDVRVFDTSFFSIPADEARAIDPQQRILLEVSVEALDSAGVDRDAIRKSDTGVWVGSFVKDYEQIVLRDPDDSPKYGATGNGIAIMSNRISYFLDVNGPSMTIDTGCSASLVCVHNACQSLRNGEIDVGLAGGAGLILTPNTMMPMTALNFLSPDGKCFTFDARANGYGRGEGIGIVVLKRLTDAIRDNDNIRSVIRGSSVNQDGRTPGITLPSSEAQLRNIRSVYKRAGLPVSGTAYVECHGTGTQAGDVREVKAISDAFCGDRTSNNPIYVGSIKTNIGHLEGCAGIAGLIKGVLTIEQGIIPRHLNFELPGNPAIKFDDWKVKVPISNTSWPVEGLRRASINCFGFGGTNAHVIMDDAAHYLAERGLIAHHNTVSLDLISREAKADCPNDAMREDVGSDQDIQIPPRDSQSHLFVFSAHEQKVLSRMLKDCDSYMNERVGAIPTDTMENLAYTLGCRRTKLPWRVSVTAQSPGDLVQKLASLRSSDFVRALDGKATRLAFVFGGQGAQWFGMGRELLGFDIFLKSIMDADSYLQTHLDSPFKLITELLEDELSSNINRPEISQPATTAIQIALVDVLMKYFGISPSYVCGHSSGEIAAAYALGALSLENALELAYQRGRCAGAMLTGEESSNGSMLAVGLSAHDAQKYVELVGNSRVVVACINSPTSVTLSGDKDAISELQASFQAVGIFSRLLVVSIAYHSHHMKRCETEYLRSIEHIVPRKPDLGTVPHPHTQGRLVTPNDINRDAASTGLFSAAEPCIMYSSVTGCPVSWEELGPQYWVKNMVSPVLFADAMHQMLSLKSDRPTVILEISPHSTLQGPVKQILDVEEKLGQRPAYYSTLRRGKDAAVTTLDAVGNLWSHGCDISMLWVVMRNLQVRRPKLLVDLPKYPWNHDNVYWYESHLSRANRFQIHGRYDLIGRPTADSIPFQPRWRGFLRKSETPWICDHQVQRTMIYPAAGMVTMVLEAAKQVASDGFAAIEITGFRIQKAMIIPETEHGLEYALNLNKQASYPAGSPAMDVDSSSSTALSSMFEFFIYSKQLDGPWEEHGDGFVTIHRSRSSNGVTANNQTREVSPTRDNGYYQSYLDAKNTCDELVIPRQLYETLDVIGMNYGPLFQNISSLRKKDNACVSVVCVPDTKSVMPANFEYPHIVHPATLDSIFQTAFAIGGDPMVPSFIGSLYLSAESDMLSTTGQELAVRTQADLQGSRDASASFVVADDSWFGNADLRNHPLIVIKDMTFTALASTLTSAENGFLANHHNLCSEIVWETLDGPLEAEEGDTLARNLYPTEPKSRVLILVPGGVDVGLGKLCSAFTDVFDCDIRTLSGIENDERLPEFCISLLEADGEPLVWNWSEQDFLAFRNVVIATKGILWITRGSQLEASNPRSCLIQALGRTIQSEYPTKKLISLDIDVTTDISSERPIEMIINIFGRSFLGPKTGNATETEYVEREGQIMVPRLVLIERLNSLIERGSAPAEPILENIQNPHERPLKLEIGKLGDAGSLYWLDDPDANLPISSYDVKIRVLKTSLSDLDVDIMQGRAPDDLLGTDVYGIVEQAGENVTNVRVGDCVVGIARGGLRDFVICHGDLVYKVRRESRPRFPTSFSVALHALGVLGDSDVVLVHDGAGSFGQAAIYVAQDQKATVLATAETCQQRAVLRALFGLSDEHILDSGEENFVDQVMQLTQNRGVDVIFDPGASVRDSNIKCIGEGGRIIGFANKPNQNKTAHQAEVAGKSFSCTILDVPSLIKKQPELLSESLKAVYPSLGPKQFLAEDPHSYSEYDYSELKDAFAEMDRYNAGGQICCQRPAVPKQVWTVPRPPRPTSDYLHQDATYVLSGGFGGLGVEIAKLLALNGAKHIAFLSRSGAKSELANSCIALLRSQGVDARDFKVDICDGQALEKVSREIGESMPPVKGLFQCAAVLRDSVFENMTYEDWKLATRPKTLGSWNLHRVMGGHLDFFIFLSSSAGVIGNRGQANYTAGNAFQDILARHINEKCRDTTHAVSIDLGPILEAGMLAEDPRLLDVLKASGFFGIRLQDFKRIVECAITGQIAGGLQTPAQIVTGVGTGGLIRQNKPADPYWTRTSLFMHLNDVDMPEGWATISDENSDSQNDMQRMLAQATSMEAKGVIVTKGLQEMLSKSMNMDPSDVEVSRPPSAYGVDSLVAVGVRNWVSRECSADVSIFEVLSDTSISKLSEMIVERRGTQ
ncbi:ketoacyl-synt-domain-containing protein [Annulohypoxylon maeteangense]|uniref:ketoacyl-synt-domain-containing protein n=1 Tax=Annulohypoxylon maeteangense TaxID=1927788 RepID=UPI002007D018|nr:ketoacyl-synt-domain-containing protein [Annulohypoxylon maeteangense]KAI0886112.1 ketoacyl-synt-domain-containing protein [Annulohypoxylon maeteangense]